MTSVTLVPLQMLYIYPKSSSGVLDEYLSLWERVSQWSCWMIKLLFQWVTRLETPWLNPNSFLLLQWWHQRISQCQQTPRAPPTQFPACRCPSCGPGSLSDERDVGAAHGWRPPRLTPLRAGGLQASPAVRGSLLPRMQRCPVERIFPPCRWKLGCLCQNKRPVPAPSFSGISWWLLCRSPTWGGWKEWKMRYMGF